MPEATFLGGLIFGLASALHCGAMCGGIACGAMLLLGAETQREKFRQLAIMQMGRVTTYAAIGAAGAAIGTGLLTQRSGVNFQIMQWAAATSMMWMGMTLAGIAPRLALLDRGVARLSDLVDGVTRPLRGTRYAGPFALGIMWGLNACPMVYSAAFFASLTGSVTNGVVFMTGFGIGTVPAILAAAGGLTMLRTLQSNRIANGIAGTLIALAGIASVYVPWPEIAGFCLPK